jgi:hypothetical protein
MMDTIATTIIIIAGSLTGAIIVIVLILIAVVGTVIYVKGMFHMHIIQFVV